MSKSDDLKSHGYGQNPVNKKISINEIKNCSKYNNITEDEANRIAESLQQLSIIIFRKYENEYRRF
jgi:hypothetical protein